MTEVLDTSMTVEPADESQAPTAVFALQAGEDATAGLGRIVLEQIDLALWHAQRIAMADEHVHEVRKVNKRVRAVLRLVRSGLEEELYQRSNAMIRDVARELSTSRTKAVRVDTLTALAQEHPTLMEPAAGLLGVVTTDAADMHAQMLARPQLMDDVTSGLRRTRADLEPWPLRSDAISATLGLQRTYRRGRSAMKRAYIDGTTTSFHEWRKPVKYLRYQMEVLAPMRPDRILSLAAGFEELEAGLGLDHDLADLASCAAEYPAAFESPDDLAELLSVIATKRDAFHAGLEVLGRGLYAHKPGAFGAEMTAAWREWSARQSPEAPLPKSPDG